jgi:hypothetical protein
LDLWLVRDRSYRLGGSLLRAVDAVRLSFRFVSRGRNHSRFRSGRHGNFFSRDGHCWRRGSRMRNLGLKGSGRWLGRGLRSLGGGRIGRRGVCFRGVITFNGVFL